MTAAIFNKMGSIVSTTLDVVKSELQSEIDTGFSNNIISFPIISGSTTITNGITARAVSINFSAESFLINGNINSFEIDFNDGSEIQTISAVNDSGTANHTYTSDGIAETTKDIFIRAIDDVGNKSKFKPYTLTYRNNAVPTGIIVPSVNDVFYEGETSVTFSGATDSDGTIVYYKVSNISLNGVTVSNSIVNAGQSHVFNIAPGTVTPGNPDISFTYTVSAIDNEGIEGATTLINSSTGVVLIVSESVYTTAGIYSWLCPSGVTSVSAVAVGGGGKHVGQGGGLSWTNNISVIPGNSYTVIVGVGGNVTHGDGGDSSFNSGMCSATGGHGYDGAGASSDGQGGLGTGGNGGSRAQQGGYCGGAAGYTGNGGSGAVLPQGGGGAGSADGLSGGGGVGIFGQGSNGIFPGGGGSGGTNSGTTDIGIGGLYGGGGKPGQNGGSGAVRIIWGVERSFPYNAS